MKRKVNTNKIYELIGRAVVYTSLWAMSVAGTVWAFCQNTIYQEEEMENEFEKIELYEKNGIGEIRMNGKKIKGLTSYGLKRSTDTIDIQLNISVPISNFKTVEN